MRSGGEPPRPGLCMVCVMLFLGSPWVAHVLGTTKTPPSLCGTTAACCCGSEPCTGLRASSFTHSFPLGREPIFCLEKLSPALRDLAEAQEIPLLSVFIEVVMLTGQ